ncbi:hypothetical protein RCL1_003693 [Eukaryota sp. TZLM3-RCL]
MVQNRKRLRRKGAASSSAAPKERDSSSPDIKRAYKPEYEYTNADFEQYYGQVLGLPAEEFQTFLEALRKPLPASFRIAGPDSVKELIADMLSVHQQRLSTIFLDELDRCQNRDHVSLSPQQLPWYPEGRAFTLPIDRKKIRQDEHPDVKEFHSWLTMFNEGGFLVRQEAVSMIPPLFLNVNPGDRILDMCAAPGSKSAQIIDFLSAKGTDKHDLGLLVSNDASQNRAFMMQHNLSKLSHGAAASLVTNNDGRDFPFPIFSTSPASPQDNRFSGVLCDAPCSGTGTLRKNPNIWRDWSSSSELILHPLQVQLGLRSAMLTRVGGRFVYSTCSFSPIENEAVVAALLNGSEGALKLVNVDSEVDGLIYRRGLKTWKVYDSKTSTWYDQFPSSTESTTEEVTSVDIDFEAQNEGEGDVTNVPEEVKRAPTVKFLKSTMFPPQNVDDLPLENCLRIYPHDQDTGGFFVAVFEKISELPDESKFYERQLSSTIDAQKSKINYRSNMFAPIKFEPIESSEVSGCISDFGLINEPFPFGLFRSDCLVRSITPETPTHSDSIRKVFMLTPSALALVSNPRSTLRLAGGGLQVFERFRKGRRDGVDESPYRIPNICLAAIQNSITKRKITVSKPELIRSLVSLQEVPFGAFPVDSDCNLNTIFSEIGSGPAVMIVQFPKGEMIFSVLVCKNCVKLLVPKLEVGCFKVLFGIQSATECRNIILNRV